MLGSCAGVKGVRVVVFICFTCVFKLILQEERDEYHNKDRTRPPPRFESRGRLHVCHNPVETFRRTILNYRDSDTFPLSTSS